MRARITRAAILTAMILGSSTMGTFCICSPEDSAPPPETITECGEGAAPAEGEPTLVLANPDTGLPLAEGEALQLYFGDQGGQHVFVLVRHHATAQAAWTYELKLIAHHVNSPDSEVGSNASIVDVCAPGWTESTVPVFHHSGPGDVTLRIRATTEAGAELTAEVNVAIEYPE